MKEIFNELAQNYLPWWRTDENNKDIGLRLAEIFLMQMEDNKREYNRLNDKIHIKFTELLGISLKPPKSAVGLVHMDIVNNGADGIWISKGTKLYGTTKDGEKIIFETIRGLYATDAVVKNIFAETGVKGKIRPVFGEFPKPFPVGDEKEAEIYGREEAVIYHPYIFKGDNQVFIIKADNESLLHNIEAGALGIYYFSKTGLIPAEDIQVSGERLLFKMKQKREREDAIVIRKNSVLKSPVALRSLLISSEASKLKADFVKNPIMNCLPEGFYPFGEVFGLHDECIIGQSLSFSKAYSLISIEFFLEFKKIPVGLKTGSEERLPLIKRYKKYEKYEREQTVNEVWADKVIFEYNSPKGWKSLYIENHNKNAEDIFALGEDGSREVRFYCPGDWGSEEEERFLRIRVIRSEHCYEQPCVFNTPYISDMKISYTYDKTWCMPERLSVLWGINVKNYYNIADNKEELVLFNCSSDNKEEIYVCFNKKIQDGPVSLYIQCNDEPVDTEELKFFYYSKRGFKKLMTDTGMGRSGQRGVLIFNTPSDMEILNYCNVEGYYIKIIHNNDKYSGKQWSLMPNVFEVWNVDTGKEEDYYIEEITPGMKVKLYGTDILKIDLWMDETKAYLDGSSETDIPVQKGRIRIEKNEKGETERVFVLWDEKGSFQEGTNDGRVYILDRENGNVVFGDGIREKLPTEKEYPAFKAVVYRCRGEQGNVGRGAISETVSNILFLDSLYNIEPSYGGSNRETEEERLRRGNILIGSHGRLVTAEDYYREVMNFSGLISQARVRVKNGQIYIVVLTNDFSGESGENSLRKSSSFESICMELKNRLLKIKEEAIGAEDIIIVRPLRVEISVDVWFKKNGKTDMLFVSRKFNEIMEKYLDPISGNRGNGWPIGKLPNMSQILMQLNVLREWGVVENLSVTARYEHNGRLKECVLSMVEEDFSMVVVSGRHEIHMGI